jgi:hypothetical protein
MNKVYIILSEVIKHMSKVYIIASEVITTDEYTSNIEGVFTNKDKATARMKECIDNLCWFEKENLESDYEDEGSDEFDTFEEYWADWVENGFVANKRTFWHYSNEVDMEINVHIVEKEVEE